jgi:hypothetical protein
MGRSFTTKNDTPGTWARATIIAQMALADILLNLVPIAAAAIAARWGTKFTTPLINFTLDILKWANLI